MLEAPIEFVRLAPREWGIWAGEFVRLIFGEPVRDTPRLLAALAPIPVYWAACWL